MVERGQVVRVWGIQDRRKRGVGSPFVVRWQVDGEPFSRSFTTKSLAENRRSALREAMKNGERFGSNGEPMSWAPEARVPQTHVWVRRWLDEQWEEWQPRTRRSAVEALSRFLPLVHEVGSPPPPPELRRYLVEALRVGWTVDPSHPCERWLDRCSVPLDELTASLLNDVERGLGRGVKQQPLAPRVGARYRKVARACIRRAVQLGVLTADPWPPPPRGRAQRKIVKSRRTVDARHLPDQATSAALIKATLSQQPGSRCYRAMNALMLLAGPRPSEVVAVRRRALTLPESGWGSLDIEEVDAGADAYELDDPSEMALAIPKTGKRTVPLPPALVVSLREWIEERQPGWDDFVFVTRTGKRPKASNWCRSLHRACDRVGFRRLRVYDLRHACASNLLRAGVSLAEVARRMGHTVDTLVRVYVGVTEGDDVEANQRIEKAMAAAFGGGTQQVSSSTGPHEAGRGAQVRSPRVGRRQRRTRKAAGAGRPTRRRV